MKSPSYFAEVVEAQAKGKWIVIDEIQKAPQLLNEVHRLIEKKKYKFALSGSSARKLRTGGVNLLAGRALVFHLFPFCLKELGPNAGTSSPLEFGSLPAVILEKNNAMKIERLRAYVSTYLLEEIKAEALSRNLDSFTRFLTIAALANGQVTNLSNISRDAGVSRSTVTSYFEILKDTLIGTFLPAWNPRLRIKEVIHPKFYFFDTGVYRTLTDLIGEKPSPEEKGVLFETLIFNELKSYIEYSRRGGQLYYWRTHNGVEVDFIWKRGNRQFALEVKSSINWKPQFNKGLLALRELNNEKINVAGVYRGNRILKTKFGLVYPTHEFVTRLHQGKLFR